MVRQLTAIMFADMVGYTALMQEDEALAKRSRDRNREVLEARVAGAQGKILQYYGDGTLSVFRSAIQAVESAIAIQEDLRSDPPVPLRIGIHTGDIVHDDHGVFGDGVNLAARVQGLAVPGAVLISEKVFDEVKNQPGIRTLSLGRFALKNVKRPMEVWAVTNPGLAVPDGTGMGPRPEDCRNSVAVLPFLNISADPENEFFSDGITEEIINALSRVNGLQVTARTSSFAFKGKHGDVRAIGDELGVATVLEGSVRKSGNRVRIAAQLIDTRSGYHLFSQVYDRNLDDIFQTQDELAHTIMEELREQFPAGVVDRSAAAREAEEDGHPHLFRTDGSGPEGTAPEREREEEPEARGLQARPRTLVSSHSHDTRAYTEFLKGAHAFRSWTPEGARKGIQHFQRSMELDAACALPYAGTATAYAFLAATGQMVPSAAYARARTAATRAMELEEDSGEAHTAMASVLFLHDWNFREAYKHFQKALSLLPGSAHVRQLYALYLKAVGDLHGAEEELQYAVQLDPLSNPIRTALADVLVALERFESAETEFQRVLEMDPDDRAAREGLGLAYAAQKRYDEALGTLSEINRRTGDPFKVIPQRIISLMGLGREEEARKLFHLLEERRIREPEVALEVDFCFAHLGLGEIEKALDYLEEAVDLRLGYSLFMGQQPVWAPYRAHPRLRRIHERVGLPSSVPVR